MWNAGITELSTRVLGPLCLNSKSELEVCDAFHIESEFIPLFCDLLCYRHLSQTQTMCKNIMLLCDPFLSSFASLKVFAFELNIFVFSSWTGNGKKDGLFSVLLRDYNEYAAASCMNRLAKLRYFLLGI